MTLRFSVFQVFPFLFAWLSPCRIWVEVTGWMTCPCLLVQQGILACNEFLNIYNPTILFLLPNSYICRSNILFQLRIKCTWYLLVVHPKNCYDIILSPDYLWHCNSVFFKYFLFFPWLSPCRIWVEVTGWMTCPCLLVQQGIAPTKFPIYVGQTFYSN